MKEKKARVEDALNATRAAVEEGIVPGGAWRCCEARSRSTGSSSRATRRLGALIVKRAARGAIRQIVENGRPRGQLIVEKVKSETVANRGSTREHGICRHAAGGDHRPDQGRSAWRCRTRRRSASLLLTTEALITDLPETAAAAPPMPHGDF